MTRVDDSQYDTPLATTSQAGAGSAHAPLPWRVPRVSHRGRPRRSHLLYGAGTTVPAAIACGYVNAEFIVRACNSHAALVDALQTIEAIMCDKSLCGHFTAEEIRDVVHAAIAKVEGK